MRNEADTDEKRADASTLRKTIHRARAMKRRAKAIGGPHHLDVEWMYPIERWDRIEEDAVAQLALFPPQTPKQEAPLPSMLLVSSVFSLGGRSKRQHKRTLQFSYGSATVVCTGEELRQFDSRVLLALYALGQNVPYEKPVKLKPRDLLRTINRPTSGRYYKELRESIKRLQLTLLEVMYPKGDPRESFNVQLVGLHAYNRSDWGQEWSVYLPERLREIFNKGYGQLHIEKRMKLGDGLASWLAGMLAAFRNKDKIRFGISWLHDACGSTSNLYDFRRHLKRALQELVAVGLLSTFAFDGHYLTLRRSSH